MKFSAAVIVSIAVGVAVPAVAQDKYAPNEKKLVFLRKDTQEHFWLSASSTFVGTQVLRSWGLSLGPSVGLSAVGVYGAGVAKEFLHDPQISKNDLMADALGVALGSLASMTIRFDGYFDGKDGVTVQRSQPRPQEKPDPGVLPTKVIENGPDY